MRERSNFAKMEHKTLYAGDETNLDQNRYIFCRIYPLFSHKTPSTPHKNFPPFVLDLCDFVDSKDFCIDPVSADQQSNSISVKLSPLEFQLPESERKYRATATGG